MNNRINVTRSFLPNKDIFIKYVDRIWESHHLTNQGPLHEELVKKLSSYFNNTNVTLTTNGHLALELALKGLNLSGEIITTPFTFVSTTHAIASIGATPVFCDIDKDSLTIDTNQIENLITDKTTAIMPVHVYGHLCDTERIDSIAKAHNLKVIYDAAHAFGVEKNGKSISQFGDVSMLSFHATKLFHSIEGGALLYNDDALVETFNTYKNFGLENEETVECVGFNAKMNEFQAAMGLSIFPHMQEIIEERKQITMRYREHLNSINGIHCFTPDTDSSVSHNYAYMPIIVDGDVCGFTRDCIFAELMKHNIYARKYFYPLTSDFACYHNLSSSINLPVARRAAKQVLCLPIFNGLAVEVVDKICESIRQMSN